VVTNRRTVSGEPRRTFVLDTSVLISDPRAVLRFAEHEVVLPVVVITELEGKRHHPELGYFARQALRLLDDLRLQHGRLDAPLPVGDAGGTLWIELNHADPSVLPAGFRLLDNDTRILAIARSLAADGKLVTVVSKDLPMRVKASAVGLDAEEYEAEKTVDSGWTGMAEVDVSVETMATLYSEQAIDLPVAADLPCHAGLVLLSPRGSALGRVMPDKKVRLVRGDRDVFGVHGRSAEQRIAIDLLLDAEIGIVSLGGRAGTGKSGSCAGIVTSSACTAAAPSSGSPSTCSSTPRSASSRSVAGPGRASPRSRCAPGSRPCSNGASTARSSSSGRCTRSAARTSATCRAPRPRR